MYLGCFGKKLNLVCWWNKSRERIILHLVLSHDIVVGEMLSLVVA